MRETLYIYEQLFLLFFFYSCGYNFTLIFFLFAPLKNKSPLYLVNLLRNTFYFSSYLRTNRPDVIETVFNKKELNYNCRS